MDSLPEIPRPLRVVLILSPTLANFRLIARETPNSYEFFSIMLSRTFAKVRFHDLIKTLLDSGYWKIVGVSDYGNSLYATVEWNREKPFKTIFDYEKAMKP